MKPFLPQLGDYSKFLLVFVLLILSDKALSQHKEISIVFGVSSVDYEANESLLLVSPFSEFGHDEGFMVGGGLHYYLGKKELIRINTGLQYQTKKTQGFNGSNRSHHLYVPAGISMELGKKLRFCYGAGINTKVFVAKSGYERRQYHTFQFGWYYTLGGAYRVNKALDFSLTFQMTSDLTPMYAYQYYSPGGAGYETDYFAFEGAVQIGLSYYLKHE